MTQKTGGRGGLLKRYLLLSGGIIAASAAYTMMRTRAVEQQHPPTGKFVDVDGVRLHYVEHGSGQPVLMLHGSTAHGLDFELSGLVDMAAPRYRVIVLDRPGYGYSDRPRTQVWGPEAQAELITEFMKRIGAERPIVVGHSWGAMVAVAMAMDFPQNVQGLVLLSGYYYPTLRPEVPIASQPAIPLIGDVMRYSISPLMFRATWTAMVKRIFAPAPITGTFRPFPAWLALRPGQLRASAAEIAMVAPSAMKLSQRYAELSSIPIEIIAGREDRLVFMDAHSGRFHTDVPHARFRIIEDAGHMVHHLAPAEVMEAIDSIEQGATPGRPDSAASEVRPPIQ